MRVYLKTGPRDHLMMVTPGTDSDCSDFFHPDGTKIQFSVKFKLGVAEVPSNLGQYMLDKELVQATRIIVLEDIPSAHLQTDVRVRRPMIHL
jgi:hypothetical protein